MRYPPKVGATVLKKGKIKINHWNWGIKKIYVKIWSKSDHVANCREVIGIISQKTIHFVFCGYKLGKKSHG
jgi:hypothetical protein